MSIIVFDGYCNFCSWGVQFLLRRDKKEVFLFASNQSNRGKECLQHFQIKVSESIYYFRKGNIYTASDAVLFILKDLGYPWKFFMIFKVVPRFIRDAIYRFFAKHRYQLFGRRNDCRVPSEKEKNRFL